MNKYRKYTLINILLILAGIMIGITVILGYQGFIDQKEAIQRDQYVHFLQETSLLINKNQILQQEVTDLTKEIEESRDSYQAYQTTLDSIEKLKMVLGETQVQGPGITVQIQKELPYYIFIDIMNDLFTAGAEGISINNIRIAEHSSFTENPITHQVFISHTPINAPYTINIIGDTEVLTQNLSKKHNVLSRIAKAYNFKNEDITVKKGNNIILPAK